MATPRIYSAQFENVAVSAVQDIFSILAASTKGFELRYISLGAVGQTSATEFRLSIKRLPTTVTQGSGGTSPTINKLDSLNGTAATSTVHANDTTQASTNGTAVTIWSGTWDVLLPFEYIPAAPEERPTCGVSECLVLTLNAAPSLTNISGCIMWCEYP